MQSTHYDSQLPPLFRPDVNREFHTAPGGSRTGLPTNTVYLIDDDLSVLATLSTYLITVDRSVVCFRSAAEYREYGKPGEPNCIIIDMQLPDINGSNLQWHIGRDIDPAVIFTTDRPDVPGAVLAMKAGAVQVLTTPVDQSVLIEAVSEAIAQDTRRRLRRAELVELQQRFSLLTPREREVVPLIVGGLLNKQAASILGISEVTLQIHRGQVMRKMLAGSVAELVRMALKLRIPHWVGKQSVVRFSAGIC